MLNISPSSSRHLLSQPVDKLGIALLIEPVENCPMSSPVRLYSETVLLASD